MLAALLSVRTGLTVLPLLSALRKLTLGALLTLLTLRPLLALLPLGAALSKVTKLREATAIVVRGHGSYCGTSAEGARDDREASSRDTDDGSCAEATLAACGSDRGGYVLSSSTGGRGELLGSLLCVVFVLRHLHASFSCRSSCVVLSTLWPIATH
jgi:hypothetical protein